MFTRLYFVAVSGFIVISLSFIVGFEKPLRGIDTEHRQLKNAMGDWFFFRKEICHYEGDGIFQTKKLGWLIRNIHLRFHNEDSIGACAMQCSDLCEHQPCHKDFTVSADEIECSCLGDVLSPCGSNTECVNDECQCLPGYTGNPLESCLPDEEDQAYLFSANSKSLAISSCTVDSVEIHGSNAESAAKVGDFLIYLGGPNVCSECTPLFRKIVNVQDHATDNDTIVLTTTFATFEELFSPTLFSEWKIEDTNVEVEPLLQCDHSVSLRQLSFGRNLYPTNCHSDWIELIGNDECRYTNCNIGKDGDPNDCFACGGPAGCDNGCGPADGIDVVPDNFGMWDFSPACCNHDLCYSSKFTKATCDQQFLQELLNSCPGEPDHDGSITIPIIGIPSCKLAANMYYQAVHLLGGDPHGDAQLQQKEHEAEPVCGCRGIEKILCYKFDSDVTEDRYCCDAGKEECCGDGCCGNGECCQSEDAPSKWDCCSSDICCDGACCDPGEICCGGACCPVEDCNDDTCGCKDGEIWCGDSCCDPENCCGGSCCSNGRCCPTDGSCISKDGCCPNEKDCGSSCKPSNACCPGEQLCGGVCDLVGSGKCCDPPCGPDPDGPPSNAGIKGEPFVTSFDGLHFACQGEGEFILAESSNGLKIQARFEQLAPLRPVTMCTGIAMSAGPEYPTVQLSFPMEGTYVLLYVNGNRLNITDGYEDAMVNITSFASAPSRSTFLVKYLATGLTVSGIQMLTGDTSKPLFNYRLSVPRSFTNVRGLLGTPDGDSTNDWRTKDDNSVIPLPNERYELESYDYCTREWCIRDPADSIFYYEGLTFYNFSRCDKPYGGPIDTSSASPELRALCGISGACLRDGIVLGVDAARETLEAEAALGGTSLFYFYPSFLKVNTTYTVSVTVDLRHTPEAASKIERYAVYKVDQSGSQLEDLPVVSLEDSGSGLGADYEADDYLFSREFSLQSKVAGESLGFQAIPIIQGSEDPNSVLAFLSLSAIQSFSSLSGIVPVNDECQEAFLLVPHKHTESVIIGCTDGATIASPEKYSGSPVIYYRFIGTNRRVRISTCTPETSFNTALYVDKDLYCDVEGGLSWIDFKSEEPDLDCDPTGKAATVEFYAHQGTEYGIAVAGRQTSEAGTFGLSLFQYTLVENDECQQALLILPRIDQDAVVNASTVNASRASPDKYSGSPVIYYRFIGTDRRVRISTCTPETSFNSALYVDKGLYCDDKGGLSWIDFKSEEPDLDCDPTGKAATVEFYAQQGTEYGIAVAGRQTSEAGTFGLSLFQYTLVENDECQQAQLILPRTDQSAVVNASTVNASRASPDKYSGSPVVYYRFTGQNKNLRLSTCTENSITTFNTSLYVNQGLYCDDEGGLSWINFQTVEPDLDCDPTGKAATVEFYSKQGTEYVVAVAGRLATDTGDFGLSLVSLA